MQAPREPCPLRTCKTSSWSVVLRQQKYYWTENLTEISLVRRAHGLKINDLFDDELCFRGTSNTLDSDKNHTRSFYGTIPWTRHYRKLLFLSIVLMYIASANYILCCPGNLRRVELFCNNHSLDREIVNSLAPGKIEWNFRWLILQIISMIDGWGIFCDFALRYMSLDVTDD